MKANVYETVTNTILAELEKGNFVWNNNRWKTGNSVWPLRHNGQPYSGINVLLLWVARETKGYSSNTWMTYKQAQSYGANVIKGEKATAVVFSDFFIKEEGDVEKKIFFTKTYSVFNVDQIENLPEKFTKVETPLDEKTRMENVERFFANVPAKVKHGGDRAFYVLESNDVNMPKFEDIRCFKIFFNFY